MEKQTDLYSERLYHKEDDKSEEVTRQSIEPSYARPTITNFFKSKERDIRLNLELPKKELGDFIERLKDESTDGKVSFLSVDELFNAGTDEKNKPSYTGKRLADMLFIYDYVTHKLDYAKNNNNELKKKCDEEICIIENGNYTTWSDKLVQIENVKEFFRGSYSEEVTPKNIISNKDNNEFLMKVIKKNTRTIEDDYYIINQLIENCEYKKLLRSCIK